MAKIDKVQNVNEKKIEELNTKWWLKIKILSIENEIEENETIIKIIKKIINKIDIDTESFEWSSPEWFDNIQKEINAKWLLYEHIDKLEELEKEVEVLKEELEKLYSDETIENKDETIKKVVNII